MTRLCTVFLILLVSFTCGSNIGHPQDKGVNEAPDASTWMPDADLRTAVRSALGLNNSDALTHEEMMNLTELIARSASISNIAGLEHATNLTALDLRRNNVSDITPVSGLTNLTDLWLAFNQITDVSALRNLTNLKRLTLRDNQIGDITDLGSLTNLQILWLKNCGISDVSPLQNLTSLTTLRIAGNELTNAYLLGSLDSLTDIDIDIPASPDTTGPAVSISVPSGTQTSAFNATITFSETVSGFVQSDVSLTGSAASISRWSANSDNTVYTATITPTASGTVTVGVAANVVTDAANNQNTAATSQTVTIDVDRPAVTIGVPSGTQTGAFGATITFSETVSGFVQSDVTLAGSAARITGWSANSNNTVYTATITPTASGTLTIGVGANVATDAANNQNTAATSKTVNVSVDTTAPEVSISVPSETQNGAFNVTITFTETVLGFTQSDVSLRSSAASITSWSANSDDTVYTATIAPTASGTVTIAVAANVATDAANNSNTAASSKTVSVDVDAPTVTIGVPSGTQTGAFDASTTFSEVVFGFTQSEVSLTGSAASITGWRANSDDSVYTATITPTASGTVTIGVAANVANDGANNANTAATSKNVTVSVDTEPPGVSIGVPSGVQNSAFYATITFTEEVLGFTQSELSLAGTATASITAWQTTDNTTFTATITPTTSGTVTLNVFASGATDAANNQNTAATAQTVTVDVDKPTVTISVPSVTQTNTFNAIIIFSEAVLGFGQSDLSLTGSAASITAWNANSDNTTYTATITPTTSGTVMIGVAANVATDGTNNPNTAATSKTVTVNVDTTAPNVSISVPSGVQNGAFSVTIIFAETVSGFVGSDVSLSGSAASITSWSANSDNTVYTATITPTASGTVTVGVDANAATDAANNQNTAATSKMVTVDVDRPKVSISVPSDVQIGAFDATITFSEVVSDFVQADVSLTGSEASITGWSANTDNTAYTATIIPTTSGTATLSVAAGVATDAASNPNTAAIPQTVTIAMPEIVQDLTTWMPDANLRNAVRKALKLASDETFSQEDMQSLMDLSGGNRVKDLTGLEHATRLTTLVVMWNNISDISPLAGLTSLTTLDLRGNNISDVTPLANLVNLEKLWLSDNPISDISSLAELTALRWLVIMSANVSDVTPLAKLVNLEQLLLAGNSITDFSSLSSLNNLRYADVEIPEPEPEAIPLAVSISVPSDVQNGAFEATITFTEAVSDFVQSDVSLAGTAHTSITAWTTTDNTTYTATITATTSGTVTISVAANVATDAANNGNTAATSKTATIDVDRPTMTIGVPSGTQSGAFNATITFSETVSGFVGSDVSLTGSAASITAWSANSDSSVYTATITPTASGTVTIGVGANVATDAANNSNTAATSKTVTVDVDKPTATIGVPSGTQSGAFDATITFSETVSGFTQSNVSLSGGAVSITSWSANSDDTAYTATITPTASGTVTIGVAASVATDAANNPNTGATSQTVTVSVDVDAPGVSISVPSGVQNGAFDVTITFTETVSGFTQSDISLTGTASASITSWNTTGDITYAARITPTTSGEVVLNVPAGVAIDVASNPNTAATSQTVYVDIERPGVSISVPSTPQNGAFNAIITFSETVSGFAQSDLSFTGDGSASITAWSANTDHTAYTATATPTSSGALTFDVAAGVAIDAASNPNTAATSQTASVDVDRPTVIISVPSGTQTGAFDVTVTFTEAVSNFEQEDLGVTGTASTSITSWNSTDNVTYTATIAPTTSREVVLSIAAGVATDAANNPNTAAISQTVTVDVDLPGVSISEPSDEQFGSFEVTITFTEAVSGFEQSDLSLTPNTAGATITGWIASDDYTTYAATITSTTSGQVTISVAAGVATDAAGNSNTAATAQSVTTNTVIYEAIDPYLATPGAGHIYEIPVVIMRFLPTSDWVNLDVSKASDYWNLGEISLNSLKTKIDVFDKRIKFMLEEGSRFRGYNNPSAPPSIGYRVIEYITVYEQTPAGHVIQYDNGFPIYAPDHHQIFNRVNMEHYVNNLGVKEIWIWQGHVMPGFQAYDPNIHQPEDFRNWAESNMSSPTTGDISNSYRNSSDLPIYNSTYTVYGYNFRRSHAEAVHNHGHHLEAILSHVDWLQHSNTDLFWNRFVGKDENGNFITGRAGWTHMPPNTTTHYEYTQNMTLVDSDIEDWTPDNSGSKKTFNANTYGSLTYSWPDANPSIIPQRVESQWYIYWMQNMPGHENRIQYGNKELTNWWVFTADWDEAISDGVRLVSPAETVAAHAPGASRRSGAFLASRRTQSQQGGWRCEGLHCRYAALGVVQGRLDTGGGNSALPANDETMDILDETTLKSSDPATLATQLQILRAQSDGSRKYQRAIMLIESILSAMCPGKTSLLANYPNPFNPETWMPYQLANDGEVQISIYDINGGLVHQLDLGHQQAGFYTGRSRAAYWDGRNGIGEDVASGVYFYTLTADTFRSTRKMMVGK